MLMAENVVLLQQRPTPKREIEVSLRPATPCEINVFIAALQSWIKKSPAIEDPKAFWQAMREDVAKYPIDVLMDAAKQARGLRGFNWTPSIKEMVEHCEHLMEPRRAELRAIHRAESDRRAREQEAVERAAEAEREAERQREREAHRQAEIERLRKLEAGARKRFGDDGPLPGDVQLADSISNSEVSRGGKPISWQAALAAGELWAAKFSRLMALAARLRQALEQGRVSWDRALTIAKMISADEANVRRQIDDIEGVAASYPGDQPTESFWRALCKIHTACGLDARQFSEDAAAAAIENLKNLTGLQKLADVRAIIDRQASEEWQQRRQRRPVRIPSAGGMTENIS
jgi:hypothetical protein